MSEVESLAVQLNTAVPVQDIFRENPTERGYVGDCAAFDQKATDLVLAFRSAGPAERGSVRSILGLPGRIMLIRYAWDRSIQAVRRRSGQQIGEGLTALAIEDGSVDVRDSQASMAVLFHSAKKLGLDASQMFDEAAGLADNVQFRAILQGFPQRPPELRDLGKGWYVRERTTEDGFTYESYLWEGMHHAYRAARRNRWWKALLSKFRRSPPSGTYLHLPK